MKAKRANGVEQYQANKALNLVHAFYSLSLLIWSIWEYATMNKIGLQFIIFCLGQIIFFLSIYLQKKSVDKYGG